MSKDNLKLPIQKEKILSVLGAQKRMDPIDLIHSLGLTEAEDDSEKSLVFDLSMKELERDGYIKFESWPIGPCWTLNALPIDYKTPNGE